MIYCYMKLRELRLTHIFFLCYFVSLLIGTAIIALLFVIGGGLQIFSIVVLLSMYTQPAIYILRRMDMYRVKSEIKYGDYDLDEKINLAIEASVSAPTIDTDFIFNAAALATCFMDFWVKNLLLSISGNPIIIQMTIVVDCVIAAFLWLDIIHDLKKGDMENG